MYVLSVLGGDQRYICTYLGIKAGDVGVQERLKGSENVEH